MKTTSLFLMSFFLVLGVASVSKAGMLFTYNQLALKDLEQMTAIVEAKLSESQGESEANILPLKEALQAVLSRPNEDDMIPKIIGKLRSTLDDNEAWEKVISQLTNEAIDALKNPKNVKPRVQATYVVFLENLLADIKPYLAEESFERTICARIRDAKINVSRQASGELKLNLMKATIDPSKTAKVYMEAAEEIKKARVKEKARLEKEQAQDEKETKKKKK